MVDAMEKNMCALSVDAIVIEALYSDCKRDQ